MDIWVVFTCCEQCCCAHLCTSILLMRLPWWLSGQESACQAGDADVIPGAGRSPGEGSGSPFQYSCLGKPMDRGAC